MPPTGAARIEDDLLDRDVGWILCLKLDPVAVHARGFVEIRLDKKRRCESGGRGCESHRSEGADPHKSDGCGNNVYALEPHLDPFTATRDFAKEGLGAPQPIIVVAAEPSS